jgi:hypothetical protein
MSSIGIEPISTLSPITSAPAKHTRFLKRISTGPDVGHHFLRAVGERELALGHRLELQPIADFLRDAEVNRPRIRDGADLQRHGRYACVAQQNGAGHDSHHGWNRNLQVQIVLPE